MFFNALLSIQKSNLITALFLLIAFDIVTGNLKAYFWKVNDSSIGFKGFFKHLTAFVFYSLVFSFFFFIKAEFIANTFTLLIMFNYLLSIVENLGVMGVYIPDFLKVKILSEVERYAKQLEQFNLDHPNKPSNQSKEDDKNG